MSASNGLRRPAVERSLGVRAATSLLIALVVVGAGLAVLVDLASSPASAMAFAQRPTPTPPPDYTKTTCTLSTTTQVQPGAFLAGEAVAITRTARADCALLPYPVHVALVLDASASMAGEANEELRAASHAVVDELASKQPSEARIGVVSFARAARTLCALTDPFDRVQACIRRVGTLGEASMEAGLRAGRQALVAGRELWPGMPIEQFREIVVLISDGNGASCASAQREAERLREQRLLLVSVCAGRDCNVQCMHSLATSPRYYFEARSTSQILNVFEPIRKVFSLHVPSEMTLTETLPSGVRLVDDSAQPPPAERRDAPSHIIWRFGNVPAEGVTVTYRVVPEAPGYRPLSDGMTGSYVDFRRLRSESAFHVPWVRVVGQP